MTIAFAAVLACAATAALAEETIGVVKRSMGHVLIERGPERFPPRAGTELQRGDRLITGADGYATINMREAPSLSVGSNSVVALDRYAAEDTPVVERPGSRILRSLASFFAVNRQR